MTYTLLFIAALLCEVSSCMPMGSMPLALDGEGASKSAIAIVMGAGMVAGLLVSLPLGMMVDRVSRLTVMKVSVLVCAATMVIMGLLHGVVAGYVEMAMRAIGMTAFITAQFAYVSAMFTGDRKVSAVTSMGIVGNLAFAIGPALGVWLWQHGIRYEQFIYAAGLNLLGLAIVLTLPKKFDLENKHYKAGAKKKRIFIRRAWLPALAFLLACTLQGGVNFSLAVLAFQERGIVNGALLFSASAFTTVVLRYFAGRLVEKFGARLMTIPTVIFQAAGCILAAQAISSPMVLLAGMLMGVAWACVPPIGVALLFEHSSERTRGAVMGSYNLSMWGGASLGALIATVATAVGYGYAEAIYFCALLPMLAMVYVFMSPTKPKRLLAASASS